MHSPRYLRQQLLKEVALRAGVAFTEVRQWPLEKLQPHLSELRTQREQVMRDKVRRMIAMQRVLTLMQSSGMPAGMTATEGLREGYLSAEDVETMEHVTDEEVDTEIARRAEREEG